MTRQRMTRQRMTPDVVTPVLRIAILTYNGLHHSQRCIASLQSQTDVPWHAIVLDNASTDGTPAWLQALNDSRITVHCHSENLGVGGGRNWLLSRIVPDMRDDELVVFLDNDIEVSAGWVQPFLDAFTDEPKLGIAGRWAFSMIVHHEWRDILSEHNSDPSPADTVQGCCFFVRGAAARAVGLFDESLGRFWHEDDDYCIRALHAGWDVRRVRNAAIAHHEHGSGVALRPERLAGSLANQATLAGKWRAMGAIDAHGIPRRPLVEQDLPVRRQLGSLLGRAHPLLRTEFAAAIEDAARLLHTDVADAHAAVLASPATRALLADAARNPADQTGTRERATAALVRVAAVLTSRRVASDAPAPGATARGFSGVCNPGAWDDARWSDSYESLLRDGCGRDFYARSEVGWRDGQLLHALRVTNALKRDARALIVGHASERLIAALSHLVAHVTVMDQHEPTSEAIARSARRTFGSASLETTTWRTANVSPSQPFDIVLCPNLSRYGPAAAAPTLLRTLAAHAVTGGFVGVGVSVRVAGPANGRWVERSQLSDDALLVRAGLRRHGRFDDTIADETLLGAVPADSMLHWRPRLAREVAPHLVTLATLVCRRTE